MALKVSNSRSTLTTIHQVNAGMQRHFSRLSSGKRITRAADDAAGLAVAEKLKANLVSLAQASRNSGDGVSLAQVADGALANQGEMLSRMRELALQSANGTLGESERAAIQQEFDQYRAEIERVSGSTTFTDQPLLAGQNFAIQAGTDGTSDSTVTISTPATSAAALGLEEISAATANGAQAALENIDSAISTIASVRGNLGSTINRLSAAQNNVATSIEHSAAAMSRIADTDYPEETSALTARTAQLKGGIKALRESWAVKGLLVNRLL